VAPAGRSTASFEAGSASSVGATGRSSTGLFAAALPGRRRRGGSTSCRRAHRRRREGDRRCARRYGSLRLLRSSGPSSRRRLPPEAAVGFSDITALHAALQAAGWTSIHGPVLTQLGAQPPAVVERLVHLLESTEAPAPPLAGTPLVGGVAEGPLLGGNLSLLTRLLGTPYLPALDGAVLLLEDVGERPYRLDRMWTHLALAGVFDRVRGLALGEFTECEEPDADYGSAEVLAGLAAEVGLPCVGAPDRPRRGEPAGAAGLPGPARREGRASRRSPAGGGP
jgi:muramoyltetrapeptide carboxypeptidase